MTRPILDDRDPQWISYLAARKAERRSAARRRRLDAGARTQADAPVELDRLRAVKAVEDLTVLIVRDPGIGAWTMRDVTNAGRRSA